MPIYKRSSISPFYQEVFLRDPQSSEGTSTFETEIIEPPPELEELVKKDSSLAEKVGLRFIYDHTFIQLHGSKFLQLAEKVGLATSRRCLKERTCSVFGEKADCLPKSQVMIGPTFIPEEDSPEMLQAMKEISALMDDNVFGDVIETLILDVTYFPNQKGEKRIVGLGVRYKKTSAHFVRPGHVVFIIFARVNPETHEWIPD